MFARIVPHYDLMNRLMSCGLDRGWRELAVRLCEPKGKVVLDIATGTGDIAIELVRQGARRAVGLDYCAPMLEAAARKSAPLGPGVQLVAGDALALPFGNESFDRVINGFLLRNVTDLPGAFREMARVLKPGGLLVCLEITHPPSLLFRALFKLYFFGVVPRLGTMVSGDSAAYSYLPRSLVHFPEAPHLAQLMRQAGFVKVGYRYLSLGTMAIHVGVKGSQR